MGVKSGRGSLSNVYSHSRNISQAGRTEMECSVASTSCELGFFLSRAERVELKERRRMVWTEKRCVGERMRITRLG